MLLRGLALATATGAAMALAAACTGEPDDDPAGAEPPAGLESFYEQEPVWTGCLKMSGECAGFDVPLDYDEPDGATVSLSVRRVPARDESEGTLFFNPGGPGISGVHALTWFAAGLPDDVRDRYDVVGFDPRGIAESEGLDCTPRERGSLEPPDYTPDSASEERRLIRWHDEVNRTCVEWDPDLVRHMSTVDVARDLDVMRAAFGDERLTYVGVSYGTVIGDIYATMFPDRVGRVVLDAPVDRLRPASKSWLAVARSHERTMRGYLRYCVKRRCPLGGSVDEASAQIDRMLERLDRTPLPAGDEGEVTEYDARAAMEYALASSAWPQLTKALRDAVDGDGTRIAALARRWDGAGATPATTLEVAGNATTCLDSPERLGVDGVRGLVSEYDKAAPVFGEYFAWMQLTCARWPVKPAAEPPAGEGEPDRQVLVIGGLGDPLTPYADAVRLADRLDSAVLLTSRTYGHGAYARGITCIDEKVNAYLLDGEVPAEGTSC